MKTLVRHTRWRVRYAEKSAIRLSNLTSRMEQLRKQNGVEAMHRLGDASISRYGRIVGRHQHVVGIARRFVHARYLQHDEADSTPRPRLLIGHQRLIDRAVDGQRGVVPGGHDAVLERTAANPQRLEKTRKRFAHSIIPRLSTDALSPDCRGSGYF